MVADQSAWALSLDCSTSQGSIYLVNKSQMDQRFFSQWTGSQSHSEVLTLEVQKILKKAHINGSPIKSIFCGCGPGSFTGIRVALNFARALGFSNQADITTVNTLRVLAESIKNPGDRIFAVCYAFRNLVYWQEYLSDQNNQLQQQTEARADSIVRFAENIDSSCVLVGPDLGKLLPDLSTVANLISESHSLFPSAQVLFECATNSDNDFQPKGWKSAKPLYIRASEAEEKLRTGELKPQKKL